MGDKASQENKKHDLRDKPSTSLRDTNIESPLQEPEHLDENGRRIETPRGGGRPLGQNTRQ